MLSIQNAYEAVIRQRDIMSLAKNITKPILLAHGKNVSFID